MNVIDRYNKQKTYTIDYKGEHYTIQQFIKGFPVSRKLRLGLVSIADIVGLSKEKIKENFAE